MVSMDYLVLIISRCGVVRLCRIDTIPELASLDAAALTATLQPLAKDGFILKLGNVNSFGFVWVTNKGRAAALAHANS